MPTNNDRRAAHSDEELELNLRCCGKGQGNETTAWERITTVTAHPLLFKLDVLKAAYFNLMSTN